MKRKLCPHCKGRLGEGERIHPGCIDAYADAQQAKAERKAAKQQAQAVKADRRADKERRERLKSRAEWAREAQAAFNSFIRARDKDQPCISCGRFHDGQWHAGHYLSRGARPELAYNEDNCHKQCAPCNTHMSGNLVLYRVRLIEKIGMDRVDWLEGPHQPLKLTIQDLKQIRDTYRAKAKALERNTG